MRSNKSTEMVTWTLFTLGCSGLRRLLESELKLIVYQLSELSNNQIESKRRDPLKLTEPSIDMKLGKINMKVFSNC